MSKTNITITVSGMHCSSCAMNIDGELEETEGVIQANTSYAKSKTVITYDSAIITSVKLIQAIELLGYHVTKHDVHHS